MLDGEVSELFNILQGVPLGRKVSPNTISVVYHRYTESSGGSRARGTGRRE